MRPRAELQEMDRWNGMAPEDRDACIEEARKLLVTSKRWSLSVKWPDKSIRHVGEGRFEPVVEEHNAHLMERMDNTIKTHLDSLKASKVEMPLTPFYVAVWQEAMAIPGDQSAGFDKAIVLAMLRVQSTAHLVGAFKNDPDNTEMRAELVRRGLLRR